MWTPNQFGGHPMFVQCKLQTFSINVKTDPCFLGVFFTAQHAIWLKAIPLLFRLLISSEQ